MVEKQRAYHWCSRNFPSLTQQTSQAASVYTVDYRSQFSHDAKDVVKALIYLTNRSTNDLLDLEEEWEDVVAEISNAEELHKRKTEIIAKVKESLSNLQFLAHASMYFSFSTDESPEETAGQKSGSGKDSRSRAGIQLRKISVGHNHGGHGDEMLFFEGIEQPVVSGSPGGWKPAESVSNSKGKDAARDLLERLVAEQVLTRESVPLVILLCSGVMNARGDPSARAREEKAERLKNRRRRKTTGITFKEKEPIALESAGPQHSANTAILSATRRLAAISLVNVTRLSSNHALLVENNVMSCIVSLLKANDTQLQHRGARALSCLCQSPDDHVPKGDKATEMYLQSNGFSDTKSKRHAAQYVFFIPTS